MVPGVTTRPPTIGDAIRQTTPFHSMSQEALLGLIRAADDAKRCISDVVEGAGITLQQYNVLRILRGAGDGGLPTLAIGERMIERTPGVTRLIDRMEKKGLVARKRCTEDRRRVWCRITDGGLALIAPLDEPVRALDDTLFEILGVPELVQLVDYLDRVRANMAERRGE